jgi:NAD(P)-dependent dehydrogenase (short-subunit alcohol dehydrogenase family)
VNTKVASAAPANKNEGGLPVVYRLYVQKTRGLRMELGLADKVVLVCGGSKGIGLAIAKLFAAEGARVAITSRSETNLKAATDLIASARAFASDLSREDQALDVLNKVESQIGPIAIAVNCAGAAKRLPPDELSPQAWRNAMDAKFFSYLNVIDPLIKRMAARRSGVIVNIIGNGGKVAAPTHIAGGAANAALMLATVGLATAYAPYGVRVVGLNPGLTETDRVAQGMRAEATLLGTTTEEAYSERLKSIPLGRMASPEEIANAALFVASDKASYITGVNITMDGMLSSVVI